MDHRPSPTVIEHHNYFQVATDPYARLLSERIVYLGTAVDDATANDVIAQLLYLDHDHPERDIRLYLNSPGGSFSAMLGIYDTMRFVSADLVTVCLGQAASVAAVLLAAGTAGKRLVLPNSRVLLAEPAASAVTGSASDLATQADDLGRARATLVGLLARHTGRNAERIAADLGQELLLTGPAALEYGLADQLTVPRERTPA